MTHGESSGKRETTEHRIWRNMKDRCSNPKNPAYKYYGGRGIVVCERWKDYAAFLADVGRRPSSRVTLDRIDNDGNYELGNMRWATWHEQALNRRVLRQRKPYQRKLRMPYGHKIKTHCKRGHELTAGNVYRHRDGCTSCRLCAKER